MGFGLLVLGAVIIGFAPGLLLPVRARPIGLSLLICVASLPYLFFLALVTVYSVRNHVGADNADYVLPFFAAIAGVALAIVVGSCAIGVAVRDFAGSMALRKAPRLVALSLLIRNLALALCGALSGAALLILAGFYLWATWPDVFRLEKYLEPEAQWFLNSLALCLLSPTQVFLLALGKLAMSKANLTAKAVTGMVLSLMPIAILCSAIWATGHQIDCFVMSGVTSAPCSHN
jgi:hypothetical protein